MTSEEYAKAALAKCHDCDGWDADKLLRHVMQAIEQAKADEREACIRDCDNEKVSGETGTEGDVAYNAALDHAIAAIRNRGKE